jgi:hypothetical protein
MTGQQTTGSGTLRRMLLVLAAATLMAMLMSVMAVPAFAKGYPGPDKANPQPNQGSEHSDPPTEKAGHACKAFPNTPTNEPAFFQSSNVTC